MYKHVAIWPLGESVSFNMDLDFDLGRAWNSFKFVSSGSPAVLNSRFIYHEISYLLSNS
jgi:hypothetical protein